MQKKTLKDLKNLENKKVIVRVDFNVPIANNKIVSNKRIIASLKTIKYLIDQKAKLILMSHLNRIKNLDDLKKHSLKIVANELAKLLNIDVKFVHSTRGKELETCISSLEAGDVLLMENTRFEDLNNKSESKNDQSLAKYWASLADIFVNDAFGTSHREHASNVGIATFAKESAIGFLIEKEIEKLSILNNPSKPFIAIVGGAKVSDKLGFIKTLLEKADKVIVVGGMSYTFSKAKGFEIGKSLLQENFIEEAKLLIEKYKEKLILPFDYAFAKEYGDFPRQETIDNNIPSNCEGLDIGSKSIKMIKEHLKNAKTILWNGPAGVSEFSNYSKGTFAIANAIVERKDVYSIVGGGDSIAAIEKQKLEDKFWHISTGGGASMQFMEGKILPGIAIINEK